MTLESRLVTYDWKNQFDAFQQVTQHGSFKAICWDAKNTLMPVSSDCRRRHMCVRARSCVIHLDVQMFVQTKLATHRLIIIELYDVSTTPTAPKRDPVYERTNNCSIHVRPTTIHAIIIASSCTGHPHE